MKKIAGILLGTALLCGIRTIGTSDIPQKNVQAVVCVSNKEIEAAKADGLQMRAKASYLIDYHSKTVLHAQNGIL